jgi:hypothetical protein
MLEDPLYKQYHNTNVTELQYIEREIARLEGKSYTENPYYKFIK